MHNQIVEITDRLLSQAKTQGKMDVVTDFASPLPISIITHMVGIPLSDHTFFVKLTDALVGGFDSAAPPEKTEQAIGAALQLRDYYSDLIKLKRQRPTDDLLSALILAEEMGDQLTHEELMATAVLLLLAGVETTANLITNGILSLLENPDQLELLKRHPEYIDSAVEEMLRYRSPLRATFRRPLQDLDYKGYRLGKGQTVVALIAAANRDAAVFPDPDKFDITRKNNKHLTFGYGIHYCLGAPLARLESKVAISKLFQTFPNLTLATPQVQWQPLVLMAGIQSLQVIF
jgi:cytochrome P450